VTDHSLALLDGESAELLPTRQALGGITINNVVAVNLAIAVSAGGWHSNAIALANQLVGVG
jgi:hypothetical protein